MPITKVGPDGLTYKQRAFVREYMVDKCATDAAIRAGYSPRTAQAIGSRLIDKSHVAAAIANLERDLETRTGWRQDRAIRELEPLATADIGEIMEQCEGGVYRVACLKDIPARVRKAISSIKVRRYVEGRGDEKRTVEVVEFKLWDKINALQELARHFGWHKPLQVDHRNWNLDTATPDQLDRLVRGEAPEVVFREQAPASDQTVH